MGSDADAFQLHRIGRVESRLTVYTVNWPFNRVTSHVWWKRKVT